MAHIKRKIFPSNQAPDTTVLVEFGQQAEQNTKNEEAVLNDFLAGLVRTAQPLNSDTLELLVGGNAQI